MKERPILFSGEMVRAILDGRKTQTRRIVKPQIKNCEPTFGCLAGKGFGWFYGDLFIKEKYGEIGDRLWVRETFLVDDNRRLSKNAMRKNYEVDYKATSEDSPHWRWRPSIHMPRWASRITLEIIGVRIERLSDITCNDADAEGTPDLRTIENNWDMKRCFQHLWESINGAESWAATPWVWVIEFHKL